MGTLVIPRPNPKQRLFFLNRKRYVGYGGARGGGKSWALRIKLVLLAFKYPNLKLLLLRKTLPELRENHILPLQSLLYRLAKYNKDERAFLFPNGSRLKLGYCNHANDIYQYQGQEYDVIGVEECTHFTWQQIIFLMTCNRGIRTDILPRMYFTGNPGGVGHKWFKRLFIDKKYEATENPDDYDFIPATVDDNHILMKANPEYVNILENLPEKLRKAHRYGDWNVFEGQFFEEFADMQEHYKDRTWTHVIVPFEIPHEWKLYRSFDFGYAKPFSCGWWAQDFDGRLYRIAELYGCTREPNTGVKWHPERIFREIRKVETEHRWLKGKKVLGVADPSIWDESRGISIAETGERHGIYFEKGDNKRIPGWMQVHYRLAFSDDGIPMMYVFNTCKSFIRTMPEVIYSETNTEDVDINCEDHIADETRYMCMYNPIAPKKSTVDTHKPYNPLDDDNEYDRYGFIRL